MLILVLFDIQIVENGIIMSFKKKCFEIPLTNVFFVIYSLEYIILPWKFEKKQYLIVIYVIDNNIYFRYAQLINHKPNSMDLSLETKALKWCHLNKYVISHKIKIILFLFPHFFKTRATCFHSSNIRWIFLCPTNMWEKSIESISKHI